MKTSLLAVLALSATAVAQTYTLTSFGAQCGGALQGQVVTASAATGVRLGVTGAQPNALAILVVGRPHATPVQLPGSQCLLLVDPRHTQFAMTSATGSARFGLRIPPTVPISIDFQAVIVGRSMTGRVAESTNGIHLDGV